jgi:hypothetical protein
MQTVQTPLFDKLLCETESAQPQVVVTAYWEFQKFRGLISSLARNFLFFIVFIVRIVQSLKKQHVTPGQSFRRQTMPTVQRIAVFECLGNADNGPSAPDNAISG